MSNRFFNADAVRYHCDALWSRAMFAGCTFGVIALALGLADRPRLAATAGLVAAVCGGVAAGTQLIARRFR